MGEKGSRGSGVRVGAVGSGPAKVGVGDGMDGQIMGRLKVRVK